MGFIQVKAVPEQYFPVAVYYAVQGGHNVWMSLWMKSQLLCDHWNESY